MKVLELPKSLCKAESHLFIVFYKTDAPAVDFATNVVYCHHTVITVINISSNQTNQIDYTFNSVELQLMPKHIIKI